MLSITLMQLCQMLFAGTVVAEQCGFFRNHPRTPTMGAWEGSSSANSHKSQHPTEFFHTKLFKPSVQSASLLPPVLASLLILTSNAESFCLQSWGYSFLWGVNLCLRFASLQFLRTLALHRQDLCQHCKCLSNSRGSQKAVPPFQQSKPDKSEL